jgi:O-antigen ligase
MNATTDFSPNFVSAVRVRESKFNWFLIAQICVCVLPAMATIDLANPLLGARYLVGMLFLFLGYHGLRRDRYQFLGLVIGVAPAIALMRGLFFYDGVTFFLIAGTIVWAVAARNELEFVWSDPIWKALAGTCLLYWFCSFIATESWHSNSRAVELFLAAAAVCLVSNNRAYLATAVVGMAISISAYAIAMLPYGVRLGEGELDNGETIGNPALLGIPAALIVLIALTDRGRLLLMEKNVLGRLIICLSAGEWLILSGSRGSWTITLFCMMLVFAFSKQSRKPILIAICVVCMATLVVLSTDRGDKVSNVFDKTVDTNRSLANRTSGRSNMWAALPSIFAKSPIWGWGAGSGRDVDYVYTGRHLELHSLYLQVIAETGLLGAIPLFLILAALIRRAVLHMRRYGEVMPLIGVIGFMFIGVSVTALDIVSGIYLGLALMAREPRPRFSGFQVWQAPDLEDEIVSS